MGDGTVLDLPMTSRYETVAFVTTFRYSFYGIRSLDGSEMAEERNPALEALKKRMPESLPGSGRW